MLLFFLKRLGWACLLVLIQALILNNIHIWGYVTPFLYPYLLLKFNANISRYEILFWGFFIGLSIDIFSNTLGINAAATTLIAFLRPYLLQLFTPRDSSEDFEPGIRSMGTYTFLNYAGLILFVHQSAVVLLESFSLADAGMLILKIFLDTLASLCCIFAIENLKR